MKKNKPFEFNFNKTFAEASNKYDDTNYIYNPADNGIYTEKELKKKFTATDTYNLLKSVANQQEKKEFRDIERKYKKKKPIAQRTESSKVKSDTIPTPEFPNFIKLQTAAPADDTLNKILKDRNKPDPDYFKGLGTFLPKKI